MRIMGSTEVAHWGQCFEEFYGQNYCKYLRKDLEKLKDEFYDGNSHRFQSEWVIPTANLLRRLRQMGFPIRTRDHIIIHLYNPVDSMAAGETHFQVGRKVPGTLTLKFTKQNNEGVFVIQPKTLSNKDEMKLNDDPIEFLNKVRLEMKDSCLNMTTLLQTLVLMTDNCKLERQSIKAMFFGWQKVKNIGLDYSSVQDCPSLYPAGSGGVSFNPNRIDATQQGTFVACNAGAARRTSETNYPVPWSFCVKNYVSYNKPSLELAIPGTLTNPACFQPSEESNLRPENLGALYRQARSTTWHSEPEENDETMDLYSMNEMHSGAPYGGKTDVEDLRRSMADAKLWDPPAKSSSCHVEQRTKSFGDSAWMPHEGRHSVNHDNSSFDFNVQAKVDRFGFSKADNFEKYNDLSVYQQSLLNMGLNQRFLASKDSLRRYSEPKTVGVGEYISQCAEPVLPNRMPARFQSHENRNGMNAERECFDRRNSTQERTSLTEEYAGDSVDLNSTVNHPNNEKRYLKGSFTNAISTIHANGPIGRTSMTSPRTAAVEDYTGYNQATNQIVHQTSPRVSLGEELGRTNNDSDGRRTSSLDAYIGNDDTAGRTLQECIKAKSDCGLHAVQRTNVVTDYFQESRKQRVEPTNAQMWYEPISATECGRDFNEPNESSLMSNLNVPNISLLYKDVSSSTRTSSDMRLSGSPISWMSHTPTSAPLGGYTNRGLTDSLDRRSEAVLSHDSFPSWGSHHCEDVTATVLLPVTIDEINNDVSFYQKSSATSS